MTVDTLPKALIHLAGKQPGRVALRRKELGVWHDIFWSEYFRKVRQVALGLHALGVQPGDHVAVLGENRPEWLYSALGIMSVGATFVGVYTTNPAAECEYVVGHSESVIYICEDEEQFDKALVFRSRTPKLRKMIVWDMEGLRHFQDPMLMSFDDLLEQGDQLDRENPTLFDEQVARGMTGEIAGIIYTSGTTGPPKGAMLTHAGYLWVGRQAAAVTRAVPDDETISFLPLNHVYEQIFDLMVHLTVGHIVNFTENTDTVMMDMQEVSPTLFHAVPRIWEKYYSGIVLKMDDATRFKKSAYRLALKIGTAYNHVKLSGRAPSLPLSLAYHLAYFAVFRKLKERLGFDRVRLGFSGAAPISHNILKYFQSIGIPIREGYGMTETTGITHMSDEHSFKLGTVGKALPETEVKIAEDGEILVRHQGIFKGYYRDEENTREALHDGWMHTGDVGGVDEEGYLKITDRKKEIFKTSGGKYIAPQPIEQRIKESPFIEHIMVVGENRNYTAALIIPNFEYLKNWCEVKNIEFISREKAAFSSGRSAGARPRRVSRPGRCRARGDGRQRPGCGHPVRHGLSALVARRQAD